MSYTYSKAIHWWTEPGKWARILAQCWEYKLYTFTAIRWWQCHCAGKM